jgi:NADPH:quinone reductase-like Zn-dependent oxidoreductase
MPRLYRFHQLGGPEVLQVVDEPVCEPGSGEVRLKVQAVGLNRAEALFLRGQYLEQAKLPAGVGYEAAGIVEAVGRDVDKSWIGKRASTIPAFSMNQYAMLGEVVIAPVAALSEYPPNLSPVEGAAIWMQYLTAYNGLIHAAHFAKGDFVIISAASSSVGIAAIEIANAEGAISIATTRTSSKKDELLSLGATHVIATEEEDFLARVREITQGRGARVAFDPLSRPFLDTLCKAAAVGAIIVEYGSLSMKPAALPIALVLTKLLTIRGFTLMEITRDPALLAIAKKYVYDRLADGRFHPKIAKVFPFDQAIEAFKYLESNAQVGKVVIFVQ